MNEIITAIQPRWVELIFSGKKKIEIRKTIPKAPFPIKGYIYETKGGAQIPTFADEEGHFIYEGEGKVVGEVTFYQALPITLFNMVTRGDVILSNACVTLDEFTEYAKGKEIIYALYIKEAHKYDKPRPLSDFGLKRPPQSWCYVKEVTAWAD